MNKKTEQFLIGAVIMIGAAVVWWSYSNNPEPTRSSQQDTSRLPAAQAVPDVPGPAVAAKLPSVPSENSSINVDEVVLPPHSKIAGASIGEWGDRWWRWLLLSPNIHNPARDQNGEKCQYGQQGPVWFLAGSYGNRSIVRRCSVPEGKYILLPVVNVIIKPVPVDAGADCNYSMEKAQRSVDAFVAPYATINGKSVENIRNYREKSPACFDPANTGRAISAAEGYWLMLKPPPPGEYVLKVGNKEEHVAEGKNVTVLLTITSNQKLAAYEAWPVQSKPLPETARERKSFPESLPIDMPEVGFFGAREVLQRFGVLLLRDGGYDFIAHNSQPMGADLHMHFAPKRLKELDEQYADFRKYFKAPLTVWNERQQDGKLRFMLSQLPSDEGPSYELRAKMVSDAQRFLIQALDKSVVVTDEEIRKVGQAKAGRWTEITAHRTAD